MPPHGTPMPRHPTLRRHYSFRTSTMTTTSWPHRTCGGCQPPMAGAHGLGGRGVLPSRWSQLRDCVYPFRVNASPINTQQHKLGRRDTEEAEERGAAPRGQGVRHATQMGTGGGGARNTIFHSESDHSICTTSSLKRQEDVISNVLLQMSSASPCTASNCTLEV